MGVDSTDVDDIVSPGLIVASRYIAGSFIRAPGRFVMDKCG
jgi:hypothetical protein